MSKIGRLKCFWRSLTIAETTLSMPNSIERQLRDMNHVKLEDRVADLEEKVFGNVRA